MSRPSRSEAKVSNARVRKAIGLSIAGCKAPAVRGRLPEQAFVRVDRFEAGGTDGGLLLGRGQVGGRAIHIRQPAGSGSHKRVPDGTNPRTDVHGRRARQALTCKGGDELQLLGVRALLAV